MTFDPWIISGLFVAALFLFQSFRLGRERKRGRELLVCLCDLIGRISAEPGLNSVAEEYFWRLMKVTGSYARRPPPSAKGTSSPGREAQPKETTQDA